MNEPWEADAPLKAEWTDLAYDAVEEGRLSARVRVADDVATEVVEGVCPRCGDPIQLNRPRSAVTAGSGVLADSESSLRSEWTFIDLRCGCTEEHPGRPIGLMGCGIGFRIPARVVRQ